MIEPELSRISVSRQCMLVGLPRSTLYYDPLPESEENLLYMRLIDKQYTKTPFYGSRRMSACPSTPFLWTLKLYRYIFNV